MTASTAEAVALTTAHPDPDVLLCSVRAFGSYWNQSRYVPANAGDAFGAGHPLVARGDRPAGFDAVPIFRADWFRWGEGTVHGRELAAHPGFAAAARRLHGGEHVVPFLVHVNLNVPGPVHDAGHVDVPAFRGLDRRNAPGWLLLALIRAGTAQRWRVRTVTAVSWLFRGAGGEFVHWPDGPSGRARRIDHLWNHAIVFDADSVHHRVDPVGTAASATTPLTRDAHLDAGAQDSWVLHNGAGVSSALRFDEVRVSISWKAAVFEDGGDAQRFAAGDDPLTIETAAELLREAVNLRGGSLDARVGVDDPAFVRAVESFIPRVVPAAAS